MNLLVETAPDYIVVRGKKIKINSSFDAWVRFIIATKKEADADVGNALTQIFVEVPEGSPQEVIVACMNWMLDKSTGEETKGDATSTTPAFDFEVDGNVIYCELWEYFPHLMTRGISYHEGMELIKLLLHNENTMLWHRAFARCGDFSKMDKERKQYWMKQRATWAIKNQRQSDIDAVLSTAF